MAFGIFPKYVKAFNLGDLDDEHFLILATEAASKLGWSVSFLSETGFIAYTKISWASWSEEVTVEIDDGTANIKSACTGGQLMDWGKNQQNVDALLSKIHEVSTKLTPEEIESKLAQLRSGYMTERDDILRTAPLTTKEKLSDFLSIFKPTQGYAVSPILINLNILVFVVMVISGVHILMPENQELINWGANFRPITLEGQAWRLLTACFLHIGAFHLLINMYALFYVGILLEPYLGKTRFIAAYLISGVAASTTSLWWNDFSISVGASGAIFGMYGVFFALLTTNLLDQSVKKALLTSISVFVGYTILSGLMPNSGIDNAAHIGGLLSGLIIGYAFVPTLKLYENKIFEFSTIGVLSIALLLSSLTVFKAVPNDIGKYEKEMERFVSMESMALEVYSLPEGTSNEMILSELKNRGMYYWNENLKLLNSFDHLDLPLTIRTRNNRLKEYCEFRIKCYELIYKAIEEDTEKYENEINDYNLKIEAIVTELNTSP